MPMTASTLAGGGAFRKLFGLISSASTDGTALSLTISHNLSAAGLGLNATVATQLVDVSFLPVGDASALAGGTQGWFLASIDADVIKVGRSSLAGGASGSVLTNCIVRFNNTLIQ